MTIPVELFTPDGSWTRYLTECSPVAPDGTPCLAFGLACGFEDELGYVSLDELRAVRGHPGLPIERDLWRQPMPLIQVQSWKVR